MKIRRTHGRDETSAQWQVIQSLALLIGFSTFDSGAIGNGSTAGTLRTTATVSHRIAGTAYSKASTDDLWNLAAQTDTVAGQYRAYWLLLNSSGTASIGAGANASSAADALAALPVLDGTKSVVGVYVAGPETDFDDAGGLAAQGTIYNQIPEGVRLAGNPGLRYVKPAVIELTGY